MRLVNTVLCEIFGLSITGWKLVGYAGVLMFGGRWLVQVIASRKARRPVVPIVFWIISMGGSLLCLSYFIFGKNDSVGVLGYIFPSAVAGYNLYLDITHKRRTNGEPSTGD
jgi:lipid-A-disaccharide synthase-like uncharacterized protein